MTPNPQGYPSWQSWAQQLIRVLQPFMTKVEATFVRQEQLYTMPIYTVSTLPSASIPGRPIYVSDETGGATVAFSDGTNWRRVQDRAVVS
jgi:hypothetical protein